MKALGNFYRFLWSHIGGRPWTYILRDFYHELEYAVIIGALGLGYAAAYFGWLKTKEFALMVGAATIGYILGHLFWGTRWIPGQEAPKDKKEEP